MVFFLKIAFFWYIYIYIYIFGNETPFHVSLHFFSKFSLAWIFTWQHQFRKDQSSKLLPVLGKQLSVKWWDNFNATHANAQGVYIYI